MKVKDLLEEIKKDIKTYGKKFLEFDVYTEQLKEFDKIIKRRPSQIKNNQIVGQGWEHFTDSDDWEYFQCFGYHTINKKKKIFTVNVNY